jgi:hypothetical protein
MMFTWEYTIFNPPPNTLVDHMGAGFRYHIISLDASFFNSPSLYI